MAKLFNYQNPTTALFNPYQFIQVLLSHIQAYLEPCLILAYTEIWHIWNAGIFRTLPWLHHITSEPCHIYKNS